MTARLRDLDIEDPAWLRFIAASPSATVFHLPAWSHLLAGCYGYRVSAAVVTRPDGEVVAGLPTACVRSPFVGERLVSLPFTDYCPPVAYDDEALTTLTAALSQRHAGAGAAPLLVHAALPTSPQVHPRSDAVRHTLALSSDAPAVFETFKRTQVRQCVAKAMRDGVTVRRGDSLADLRMFYELQVQTRRRLGVPVQPLRFFERLWGDVLARGLGFVMLADLAGEPVAGAVFLTWNGTIIYKYSASEPRAWPARPNHLVLWTAIRWACDNGFHTFDFGRTDLDTPGLRAFKSGWGTCEQPLVYSVVGERPAERSPSGQATRVLAPIIRNSPPLICRAIGQLFYRYAA
jgi:CelD/BcsL family acetyltransferase involved in cellulose biosynthesis